MKYQLEKPDLMKIRRIKNFVGKKDRHPLQYIHTIKDRGRTFVEATDGRMWGRTELSKDYGLPEFFSVVSMGKDGELIVEEGEGRFPNIEMVRDAQGLKERAQGVIKFTLDAKLVQKICTNQKWLDMVILRGDGVDEVLKSAVRITALDKNGDETQVLLMPAVWRHKK